MPAAETEQCRCLATIRDLEAKLVAAKGGKVLVGGSWMAGVEATKKEIATALRLHARHRPPKDSR